MAEETSLIRVGKVSSVDDSKHAARVIFPGMSNMVSDWLPVLKYPGYTEVKGNHIHNNPKTDEAGKHQHEYGSWMPKVNNKVLVIMEYGFNSGGYIVGVIP